MNSLFPSCNAGIWTSSMSGPLTSMAHGTLSLDTTVLCTVALETQETIST